MLLRGVTDEQSTYVRSQPRHDSVVDDGIYMGQWHDAGEHHTCDVMAGLAIALS